MSHKGSPVSALRRRPGPSLHTEGGKERRLTQSTRGDTLPGRDAGKRHRTKAAAELLGHARGLQIIRARSGRRAATTLLRVRRARGRTAQTPVAAARQESGKATARL